MKGSVSKRCTCPAAYDQRGRRKNCPKRHGSWSYVADVGFDPISSQRKQVKRGGFATREDAEQALSTLFRQVGEQGWTDDKAQTVVGWMTEWIDRQERTGKLRPSSAVSYRHYATGRITEHLGSRMKLRDLKRPAVTAMVRKMVDAGDGATTVHRCVAALRSAMTAAVRAGLIPSNPAKDLDLPNRDVKVADPWEPRELGAFLAATETDRLSILFEVLAFTGLRRGEALGLRWDDVDILAGRVKIQRQIVQGATIECRWCGQSHAVAWREPKTDAGVRTVDLDRQTTGALLAHRLRQDAERVGWVGAHSDHGLVFAREDGLPLYPTTVSHRFGQLIAVTTLPGANGEQVPLRPIKLHDLRHGAASLGIAAGVPIEVVSKRLGHSSIAVTVDVYGHLLEGVGHQAAEASAALVPRSIRPGVPTSL